MIICPKCGAENQLGRVFCGGCSSKLDLDSISRQNISDMTKVSWISQNWKMFLVIPLVLLVVILGLAFWPSVDEIGQKGTPGGSKRVENALRMLGNLRVGQVYPLQEMREQDVNGYIEYAKKEFGATFLRVQLLPGVTVVKLVKPLFKDIKIGSRLFSPKLSFTVYYMPISGKLVSRKATMGHLPLGPLKGLANGVIAGYVASASELLVLNGATEIKIDQGKVAITVKK